MRIIKQKAGVFKYAFIFDFDQRLIVLCREIKAVFGSKQLMWKDNAWRFNNLFIATELQKRIPEILIDFSMYEDFVEHEESVKKKELRLKNVQKLKSKKTTDFEVNGIKGELYPYQKIGVEFFINANGRAILADEPGTGKSLQSLAYITHTEQRKSLIICPASVKYNWEAEVKKWTKLKSFVIDAKDGISNEEWNGSDIIIINYDILKKYFDFLVNKRIDCCVCDEHHFMKNAGAVRTKAAMAIVRQSTSLLMLSATPLMNRTIELYTALNLMDPEKWNDWYSYTKRYCNGHMGDWGYECKGSSNLDKLKQEIDHYFIRRRKQDVLKDLPEKVYIKIPVKLDSKTQKEYNILENNLVEYLRDVKKKKNKEIAKSLQAEKLIKIGELRQLTTKGKVGAVKELIDSILESGEKAVIFSVYNEPIESLYESYKDLSVILTGKQSSSEKNIAATTFQADPEKKLFFGGLKSAGVGLTLTSATNVIFLDFSWIPADHIQGEDRIHRIGSVSNSVNIYQLFSKDTIDEYMVGLLAEKRKIFDKIMDGVDTDEVSSSNMFEDIMKHLENKGT